MCRAALVVGIGMSALCARCTPAAAAAPDHERIVIEPVNGCWDPPNCGDPNGTGVYTVEHGAASIGRERLMIMYFVNDGATVKFQGIYSRDAVVGPVEGQGKWVALPQLGQVVSADVNFTKLVPPRNFVRTGLEVRSITENNTVPIWQLWDPVQSAPVPVKGDEMTGLVLHLAFTINNGNLIRYDIDFAGTPLGHPQDDPSRIRRNVSTYHMRWARPGTAASFSYCHLPGNPATPDMNPPDSVVFQRQIMVYPTNGRVVHPENDARVAQIVTLSCYLGGPATITRWGYGYEPTSPAGVPDHYYFDAALQMKRASYCADTTTYTTAGTWIRISDSTGINNDADVSRIEAVWSPLGATCLKTMRHTDLGSPPAACTDRPQPEILPCDSTQRPTGSRWIFNSVVP